MPESKSTFGTVHHLAVQGGADMAAIHRKHKLIHEQENSPKLFNTLNANTLMEMEFPPLEFVIEGILPKGLTLIAGRPKKGKSWLILDWGTAIAQGLPWNGFSTLRGEVLYLALEDNRRRNKDRLNSLGLANTDLSLIGIATESPQIGDTFDDAVQEWIEASSAPKLLIIDTYSKIKPPKTKSVDDYDREYALLTKLKALAEEHDIAVALVHHQNKGVSEDPYDSVLGSTGITGAVDAMILLHGTPTGTVLMGKGRDLESFEYAAEFENCRWKILGNPQEVNLAETRKKILDALSGEVLSPKELAEKAGLDYGNVRQPMPRMVEDGQLLKEAHGKYKKAPVQ